MATDSTRTRPVSTASVQMNVPILMYHHVAQDPAGLESSAFTITLARLREQLDYLQSNGFTVITFTELFGMMEGRIQRTRKPVLLTFDDGYSSFWETVVPELLQRRMRASVFIVVNAIGGLNFWDGDLGKPLVPLMDEAAIQGVIESGMEIGVHGFNHRNLRHCTDAEAIEETVAARERVIGRFGVQPRVYCYPFGRYDRRHFDLMSRAGYSAALSICSENSTVTGNPFAMRRIYVHQGDGPIRFRLKLTGAYLRWLALRERRLGDGCH